MSTRASRRRVVLSLRIVVVLGALAALFTMHGLAPTHSTADTDGGTTGSHSGLHHLLETADEADLSAPAPATADRAIENASNHRHIDGLAHDHDASSTSTVALEAAPPTFAMMSPGHVGATATFDHHGCPPDGCSSNGTSQMIEACIVALVAATAFGLMLLRRRAVSLGHSWRTHTQGVLSRRGCWCPPPLLLSEICVSRT